MSRGAKAGVGEGRRARNLAGGWPAARCGEEGEGREAPLSFSAGGDKSEGEGEIERREERGGQGKERMCLRA